MNVLLRHLPLWDAHRGFRLEPLEPIQSAGDDDDDGGIPRVTDIDFNDDCIVSVSGYVVSKSRPWNLLRIHDNERLMQKMREDAMNAARLEIRNRPITEKFEELMELAREDPKLAAHHLAEGLRNRAMEIPQAIKAIDRKAVMDHTKVIAVQGAAGLLKAIRDPSIVLSAAQTGLQSAYKVLFPPTKDEVALQKMMDDMAEEEKSEEERARIAAMADKQDARGGRRRGVASIQVEDMSPIPITHPEAILMTITVLQEPPDLYERVPPPKWYDPALHFQRDLQSLIAEVTGKKAPVPRKPPRYRRARHKLALYSTTSAPVMVDDGGDIASAYGSDDDFGIAGEGSHEETPSRSVAAPVTSGQEESSMLNGVSGRGGRGVRVAQVQAASVAQADEGSVSGGLDAVAECTEDVDESDSPGGEDDGDGLADKEDESGQVPESSETHNDAGGGAEGASVDGDVSRPGSAMERSDITTKDENVGDGEGEEGEGEEGEGGGSVTGSGDGGANEDASGVRDVDHDNGSGSGGSIYHRDEPKSPLVQEAADGENVVQDSSMDDMSEGIKGLISESGIGSGLDADDHSQSTLTTKAPQGSVATVDIATTPHGQKQSNKPGQNALSKYQVTSITKAIWNNYKDRRDGAAAVAVKDIFDNSRRKKFEQTLIEEVAYAACIPQKFFSIEEIRKLPKNDPKLLELRKAKEDYFLEEDRLAEEKRRIELEEWQKTLELAHRSAMLGRQRMEERRTRSREASSAGSIHSAKSLDDMHTIESIEKSISNLGSLLGNLSPVKDSKQRCDGDPVVAAADAKQADANQADAKQDTQEGKDGKVDEMEQMEGESDDEYISRIAGETDEQRRARLKAEMRKRSVWGGDEASVTSSVQTKNQGQLSQAGSDHAKTGVDVAPTQAEGSPNVISGNDEFHHLFAVDSTVIPAVSGAKKISKKVYRPPGAKRGVLMYNGKKIDLNPSTPLDVTFLKLGLPNPGEIERDPKYWLARELRELTEEERLQKRLKVLRTLHLNGASRVNVLRQQLTVIRQKQAELSAIADMYLGPALKEIVRKVEPVKVRAKDFLGSRLALRTTEQNVSTATRDKNEVVALDEAAADINDKDSAAPGLDDTAVLDSHVQTSGLDRTGDPTSLEKGADNPGKSPRDIMSAVAVSAADVASKAAQSTEDQSHRDMIAKLRERLAAEEAEVLGDIAATDVTEPPLVANGKVPGEPSVSEAALLAEDKPVLYPTLSIENIQKNDALIMSSARQSLLDDDGISRLSDDHHGGDTLDDAKKKTENDEIISDSGQRNGKSDAGDGDKKSDEKDGSIGGDDVVELVGRDPEAIIREDVGEVLNVMCMTVERQEGSMYDIYDEYLQLWDDIEDSSNDVVRGCEITFVVHIDASLMQHIYLRDLQPEDIGTFLRQQVFDRKSELHRGNLTKHIVDVKFTSMFKRRGLYEMWEHMWVHFIHPVFFRYCTKYQKEERYSSGQSKGRLPGGIILMNPVDSFTESQRVTFKGLRQPVSKLEHGNVLDYDVDEIGKEVSSKLQIYRPNMSELTKKDVEKCKRIARAFKDKLDNEMRLGLVDGKRLRAAQYAALKEYQSAQRIYDLVKQKFARDERAENEGETIVPKITKITAEVFDGWMQEAKDEEAELLREKKAKALAMKELRKQEGEMRKRYNQQKTWMFSMILKHSPEGGQALASHIRQLLEDEDLHNQRVQSSVATTAEREAANKARAEFKKNLIHQEKLTRKMWAYLLKRHHADKHPEIDDLTTESSSTRMSMISQGVADPVPHDEAMKYLGLAKVRSVHDEQYAKKMADIAKVEKERKRKAKRAQQLEKAKKRREAAEKGFAIMEEDEQESLAPSTGTGTDHAPSSKAPTRDSMSLVSGAAASGQDDISVGSETLDSGGVHSEARDAFPCEDRFANMSEPVRRFTIEVWCV